MAVKLRVYFRNIVLFVLRKDGTDAWFVDSHKANLFTANDNVPLHRNVVRILVGGEPLPPGKTTFEKPPKLFGDFQELHNKVQLASDVQRRQVTGKRLACVELRGSGRLIALPSLHSHGALINWKIPKVDGGDVVQRMTEVAAYEVDGVADSVQIAVMDATGTKLIQPIDVPSSKDHRGEIVAECFVVAGEKKKERLTDDDYALDEFIEMAECFDDDSKEKLKKSIPKGHKPKEHGLVVTAEPFCPDGIVDFSTI